MKFAINKIPSKTIRYAKFISMESNNVTGLLYNTNLVFLDFAIEIFGLSIDNKIVSIEIQKPINTPKTLIILLI